MTAMEENFPERQLEEATDLTTEELRCLKGLVSYYTTILEKPKQEAVEGAWKDLQHEFPELQHFKWFKGDL